MIDVTVQVAAIGALVAITTVVTPVITAIVVNRSRLAEKAEDYTRQDAVAARAEAVSRALENGQIKAATLLVENNKVVAAAAAETQGQLKVIHTLVNSSLTAAMQSSLDDKRVTLVLMREIIDIKQRQGTSPTMDALAALEAVRGKIGELEAKLDDRKKAADAIVDEQKVSAAKVEALEVREDRP